jgi:hypothetical protein
MGAICKAYREAGFIYIPHIFIQDIVGGLGSQIIVEEAENPL